MRSKGKPLGPFKRLLSVQTVQSGLRLVSQEPVLEIVQVRFWEIGGKKLSKSHSPIRTLFPLMFKMYEI